MMDKHPMMKCGCVASGVLTRRAGVLVNPPVPYCGVHQCEEVVEPPDLTDRMARCSYGDHGRKPSSLDLAFFEYRGDGSRWATEICKCGYTKSAHEKPHISSKCPTGFTPRGPHEFDAYYCGCKGWD